MITYICSSHDDKTFNEWTGRTKLYQDNKHKFIIQKGYKNVRKAYNDAVRNNKIDSEYLCFLHHDIWSDDSFESKLHDGLNRLKVIDPNHGVVGLAGAKAIVIPPNLVVPLYLGSIFWYALNIDWGHVKTHETNAILEVDCLDGLLLIVKKEDFEYYDENDYSGVNHFYDVDMCLKQIDKKKKNYVIPAYTTHASTINRKPAENYELLYCKQTAMKRYQHLMPRASTCVLMG